MYDEKFQVTSALGSAQETVQSVISGARDRATCAVADASARVHTIQEDLSASAINYGQGAVIE